MYLTGTILKNVQSVNSFQRSTEVNVRQGNPSTIYFQLGDKDQVNALGEPLRYMPASGATVTVSISSINSALSVTKTATQPYATDTSIWSISILSTDVLTTGNLIFTLTEGATVRSAAILSAIVVESTNMSYC